ncbi:MAG: phosphohistidine phosphatase SixA [Acidobacteriota bacterium]
MTTHIRSIYLVRHAIAAERGDKWPDDAERPLTHEGAWRMRRIVKGLGELDASIDLVLTSPLVRAVETAEILVHELNPEPELATLPLLAPGGTPARIAEALAAYPKTQSVALVGHGPGIGELAAWLIGGRVPLNLKKGGVCRIDVTDWPPARSGELIFLATPKMLRALA